MRRILPGLPGIALAVLLLAGCSNASPDPERTVAAQQFDSSTITRLCYRNEYPFGDEQGHKDVQVLTLEIEGNSAAGEYNWLPAFKDKRIGQFEGSFDGRSVLATYRYTQEGQPGSTEITLTLEPDQVVVAGGSRALGLSAAIARVEC